MAIDAANTPTTEKDLDIAHLEKPHGELNASSHQYEREISLAIGPLMALFRVLKDIVDDITSDSNYLQVLMNYAKELADIAPELHDRLLEAKTRISVAHDLAKIPGSSSR